MIIERCSECKRKFKEKIELIFWYSTEETDKIEFFCEKCSKKEYGKEKK